MAIRASVIQPAGVSRRERIPNTMIFPVRGRYLAFVAANLKPVPRHRASKSEARRGISGIAALTLFEGLHSGTKINRQAPEERVKQTSCKGPCSLTDTRFFRRSGPFSLGDLAA